MNRARRHAVSAATNNAINAALYKNLPFDFVRGIAMVAGIMQGPLVTATNPSFANDEESIIRIPHQSSFAPENFHSLGPRIAAARRSAATSEGGSLGSANENELPGFRLMPSN